MSPDAAPEQRARRPLDRSARLRILVALAGALLLPPVILGVGREPLNVVLAAGCALSLLLTAVQTWYQSTIVGGVTRWELVLTWAPLILMYLLLVIAVASTAIISLSAS
jgi:hypothetical protein